MKESGFTILVEWLNTIKGSFQSSNDEEMKKASLRILLALSNSPYPGALEDEGLIKNLLGKQFYKHH